MLSSSSCIVFRNHEGLLMAVVVHPHSHIPNSCVAEAQACLDAISLAKYLDVNSLSKFLEGVTFNIVNRACNEVAHKTALLGRNSTSISVWVEEAPTVIEAAAQKDRRWVDPPN
ncbi:hypothetical protein V6N13_083017 [Hibiscus sabdariffa]